jgi:hypothetical protein
VSELGREMLDAIEQFARERLVERRPVQLLSGALRERFPGILQPEANWLTHAGAQRLGADWGAWVWSFMEFARAPATKALPNRLIDAALHAVRHTAALGIRTEVVELADAVTRAGPRHSSRVRQWVDWMTSRQLPPERFRDAVLERLPEPYRPIRATVWRREWSDRDVLRWAEAGLLPVRKAERVKAAGAGLAELVREVFGYPFPPWRPERDWLLVNGGAVRQIAEHIERSGSFDEMPVLVDALEEAGCMDQLALAHGREHRRHVPGCWLLDAVLERR